MQRPCPNKCTSPLQPPIFCGILKPRTSQFSSPRMALLTASNMAVACGILGNIVSFLVFLAPLPTFYRIYKKKSTEGFQSIPYSVALFSCMIYLYYGFLKGHAIMIMTINSIGTVIESAYLIIFMIYATKKAKIYTAKLLFLFNFGALGLMVVLTYFLSKGPRRVSVVGWICAVFSVSVFAAPLSIMRRVIKTKSVEYLPFNLSVCLTLCAVMWFFYGLLIKDYYIATPNVLGFTFGVAQMIMYGIYRNGKKQVLPEVEVKQMQAVIDIMTLEKQQAEASSELETTLVAVSDKAAAAAADGHHDGNNNNINQEEAAAAQVGIVVVVSTDEDHQKKNVASVTE